MQPLGRKVVILPKEKEETTSSGIVVVDVRTSKYAEGTVHAVGSGVKEIKPTDRVIYSPLLFDEIEHDTVVYHVVEESDIFAII
jgi:chaperonin GroES